MHVHTYTYSHTNVDIHTHRETDRHTHKHMYVHTHAHTHRRRHDNNLALLSYLLTFTLTVSRGGCRERLEQVLFPAQNVELIGAETLCGGTLDEICRTGLEWVQPQMVGGLWRSRTN